MKGKSENNDREYLFQKLHRAIELSDKKIHNCHTIDADKRAWIRCLVPCVMAYGSLLKDADLERLTLEFEEIKKDIEELKLAHAKT